MIPEQNRPPGGMKLIAHALSLKSDRKGLTKQTQGRRDSLNFPRICQHPRNTYYNICRNNLEDTRTRYHLVDTRFDNCCYADRGSINTESVEEHWKLCYDFTLITKVYYFLYASHFFLIFKLCDLLT